MDIQCVLDDAGFSLSSLKVGGLFRFPGEKRVFMRCVCIDTPEIAFPSNKIPVVSTLGGVVSFFPHNTQVVELEFVEVPTARDKR